MERTNMERNLRKHTALMPSSHPDIHLSSVELNRRLSSSTRSDGSLFYECPECHRTLRLRDKDEHEKIYHYKVECHMCNEQVDHESYRSHLDVCPGRTTFCKYCSAETTYMELERHYKTCHLARRALRPKAGKMKPLPNIKPKAPYNGVIDLAAKFMVHNIDDVTGPTKLVKQFRKKYGTNLNELIYPPLPYLLQNKTQKLRDAADIRKVQDYYDGCNPYNPYSKKPIDHYLQEQEEYKLMDVIGGKRPWVFGRGRYKPDPNDPDGPVVTFNTPYEPMISSQEIELRKKLRSKSTRNTIDFYGTYNRWDTRVKLRQKEVRELDKSCRKLRQKLKKERVAKEKKFVINQAIELEKQKSKVDGIPKKEWPKFIRTVKESRPIWPDLGLEVKDADIIKDYRGYKTYREVVDDRKEANERRRALPLPEKIELLTESEDSDEEEDAAKTEVITIQNDIQLPVIKNAPKYEHTGIDRQIGY